MEQIQAAIEPDALRLVPQHMARAKCLIPIRIQEDGLLVAMRDPADLEAVEAVRFACGLPVIPCQADEQEIEDALNERYGSRPKPSNPPAEPEMESVVGLLDALLIQAITARASDIHIEPQEKQVLIRIRVDGMLNAIKQVPKKLQDAMISRIKIMATLDISERRVPQDGKAQVKIKDRVVNLRVATLPSQHGEKIVIRVLDDGQQILSCGNLGLMPDMMRRMQEMMRQTQGILLVCGPTGSGKSTTLYSMLAEMSQGQINIVTVEDPIEYSLNGITQVQVNEKAGLTFVKSLRSILRQDPNVILVGEIRDRETAEIAMQASMTGHLVFSTLHTNSAVATIARLLDLKVDGFVLANSLTGILSQRLVRKICDHCRRQYQPPRELLDRVASRLGQDVSMCFHHGEGCAECRQTGYNGRVAVHELMTISEEIRKLIGKNAPQAEILTVARREGMRFLIDDALEKVKLGVTTIEEIDRVLFLRDEEEPVVAAAVPDVRVSSRPAPALVRNGLAGFKILLVDDHPEIYGGLVRALEKNGFTVGIARDGREALARMAAEKPDLVISDVRMPTMDGIALIKHMRQDAATAFIPVILLSEKINIEDRLLGFEAGIDDYVAKPFSIEEMLCRTQAVLKRAYF